MNVHQMEIKVPDDSCALTMAAGGVARTTNGLAGLLAKTAADSDAVIEALSRQEDGAFPLMLDRRVWLSCALSIGDERLVVLSNPSRLELEEWLEVHQAGRPCLLTNNTGDILALSEKGHNMFQGFDTASLSNILDTVSMTAFISAANGCLSGEETRDFSVLTRKGIKSRKSLVVSLGGIGVLGDLIIAVFSPPSMSLNSHEPDLTKFLRTMFSVMPFPVLRIDEHGSISSINRRALELLPETDNPGLVNSSFYSFISPEDRRRVTVLHRNTFDSAAGPFHYKAGFDYPDGSRRQFEITSMIMPDRENYIIFMVPEGEDGYGSSASTDKQDLMELVRVLVSKRNEGDEAGNSILEFLRSATGARGAVFQSKSRRLASGESTPSEIMADIRFGGDVHWINHEDSHTLVIPVDHKHNKAVLALTGIPSRSMGAPGALAAELAPFLAEFIHSRYTLKKVTEIMNSISVFMSLIQDRYRRVDELLEEIASMIGADHAVVHTTNSKEPVLRPMLSTGTSSDPAVMRIDVPSIISWAYTHAEICYVPETALDQRFSAVFQTSRSEMSIPLVFDGKTKGTLTVGSARRDAFGYPLGNFLKILGAGLALWLFRDSRGPDSDSAMQREKSTSDSAPPLEDLLVSLSHSLQVPITILRGNTDLLLSGRLGRLEEEQTQSIRSINESLVDLAEHAQRILDFMRIELGDAELDRVWGDPGQVVSTRLPILRERASLRNVELTADLPQEPIRAFIDRARLSQILGNLVDNAIQYNVPEGSVSVSIRTDGSTHWLLEVFNTGHGISSEDLPNVFDRFYTGSGTESASGMGIGLFIVRSLTQQLGGTVSVRSRKGRGTWFTVRFPLS